MPSLKGRTQLKEHVEKRRQTLMKHFALGLIKPGMLGKKQSDYQKQRAREVNLGSKRNVGRKLSEKTRLKIGLKTKGNKSNTGRRFTEEHKNKIRLSNLGKNKGKKHTTETKNKVMRATLKSVCARPNKFETRALAYLDVIYPGKFKYSGNGSFVVNGRSADAFSKEDKTVALFHGVYWHLIKHGLQITAENKKNVEDKDALAFTLAGYKVIFVWEDELDNLIKCSSDHS